MKVESTAGMIVAPPTVSPSAIRWSTPSMGPLPGLSAPMLMALRGLVAPLASDLLAAAEGDLSLEVRVVGIGGKRVEKSSMTLWRLVPGRGPLEKAGAGHPDRLREAATGRVWERVGSAATDDRWRRDDLAPGTYRATVRLGQKRADADRGQRGGGPRRPPQERRARGSAEAGSGRVVPPGGCREQPARPRGSGQPREVEVTAGTPHDGQANAPGQFLPPGRARQDHPQGPAVPDRFRPGRARHRRG